MTRRYAAVDGFFERPRRVPFVEVADVDVDVDDNVFVFTRGPRPVIVFDRDGHHLDHWGEHGVLGFTQPHGLTVSPDGHVYTADTGDHTVRKWTKDGHLLLTIGTPHANAPEYAGIPFNQPTKVDVGRGGEIYVSDGYGNARVHVFDPSGAHRFSWGSRGNGPGEFDLPHGLFVDRAEEERVYVADRYNDRVQIFSTSGEHCGEWRGLDMPNNVRRAPDGTFVVAELGHRVSVLASDGRVVARFGDEGATVDDAPAARAALATSPASGRRGKVRFEPGAGRCCAPHGVAVDSRGAIYVAEVAESWTGLDRGDRAVQKFVPA
jgi:DNA-binding beta-propeller fold protein YncE